MVTHLKCRQREESSKPAKLTDISWCTLIPLTSMYVRFSELPSSQKKFYNAYEFSNEKSGSKREKRNYFFVNST